MKNSIRLSKAIIVLGLFLGLSLSSFAQGGPPPPPSGGHGETTNQLPEGGNAPVGGGLAILLGLGIAWGAGKMVIAHRKEAQA